MALTPSCHRGEGRPGNRRSPQPTCHARPHMALRWGPPHPVQLRKSWGIITPAKQNNTQIRNEGSQNTLKTAAASQGLGNAVSTEQEQEGKTMTWQPPRHLAITKQQQKNKYTDKHWEIFHSGGKNITQGRDSPFGLSEFTKFNKNLNFNKNSWY